MSLSANAAHILDDYIECTAATAISAGEGDPLPIPSNYDGLNSDRGITYRAEDAATRVGH